MYSEMIIDREELKATWRQMVESDVAQIAEQFKRMYIDACLNVVGHSHSPRCPRCFLMQKLTRAITKIGGKAKDPGGLGHDCGEWIQSR